MEGGREGGKGEDSLLQQRDQGGGGGGDPCPEPGLTLSILLPGWGTLHHRPSHAPLLHLLCCEGLFLSRFRQLKRRWVKDLIR
jgi:hypothetical protein